MVAISFNTLTRLLAIWSAHVLRYLGSKYVNDNKYVITSDHLQPESCINEFCSKEDLSGVCRYYLYV